MADKVTDINKVSAETVGGDSLTVSFTKTYNFEGENISEVDFSGLEDVDAKTMIKANKALIASNDVQIMPENSLHYALIIASECTRYPIEFYMQLKPRDAIRVKNVVTNFIYGGESD